MDITAVLGDIIAPVTVCEDLSNANVQCTFLTTSEVNNICAHGSEEELQQWSIYKVDNAFVFECFGTVNSIQNKT